jgi:hypothetical protein
MIGLIGAEKEKVSKSVKKVSVPAIGKGVSPSYKRCQSQLLVNFELTPWRYSSSSTAWRASFVCSIPVRSTTS